MVITRKKIIAVVGAVFISVGAYYAATQWYGITPYRASSDRQAVLDIIHKDWYWLVSEDSVGYSAEYTFDHHASTPEYPDGSLRIFVYRLHNKPVGFITYYNEGGCKGRIQFVAVAQEYRNHGYAKKMLQYVIDDATANGICSLNLVTRTANHAARKAYTTMGFKQTWEDGGFVGFEKNLIWAI